MRREGVQEHSGPCHSANVRFGGGGESRAEPDTVESAEIRRPRPTLGEESRSPADRMTPAVCGQIKNLPRSTSVSFGGPSGGCPVPTPRALV